MDQHEQDWLDLGRQLKNYQPAGQPGEDFLEFQKLQRKEKPRRFAGWIGWWLFPVLILLLSGGLYWREASSIGMTADRPLAAKAVLDTRTPKMSGETPTTLIAEATEPKPANFTSKEETGISTSELNSSTLEPNKDFDGRLEPKSTEPATVLAESDALTMPIGKPKLLKSRPIDPDFKPEEVMSTTTSPPKATTAVEALSPGPIDPLAIEDRVPRKVIPIDKKKSLPRLTLGAGLSNHWRGERFMQDVDRGLYVNLGLYQPIGRRFGLEGQVGYRAHDLNVPVLSDAKKPWSYHKDEIHNTGHMGETRVYIYEGIVEGYRALEFSLLVHYQLEPKVRLHAGARYALPAIKFRRLVHGPDDENPFHDFIEQQEIVKSRDYGGILGINYRLTNRLSLQGEVHLGLVDLIENAAQEGERFNRSNSLSVGVRYSFE